MEIVLDSIQPVIKNSRRIHINNPAITRFATTVKESDFEEMEFSPDTVLKSVSENDHLSLAVVYCAINFCYWGEPKWTITIEGKDFDGAAAMLRALKRGVEGGYPLLDPKYLATLPEIDLQKILAGNVEIPLFLDRLRLLRELGQVVTKNFGGSFEAVIDKGGNDAVNIVKVLVDDIPTVFDDAVDYQGHRVAFYKRAQLVPNYINDLKTLGLVAKSITGLDRITAFADYKVPQLLRKAGILEYSDELAEKVDNRIEIPSGSDDEIEIRANTVWAIELATRALKPKFPKIIPGEVDGIFWFRGQKKSPDDKPYHRTRTIWY